MSDYDPIGSEGTDFEQSSRAVAAGGEEIVANEFTEQQRDDYTYHIEPRDQGGARYVRCEGCGREVIPADPNLLCHPDECPNSD